MDWAPTSTFASASGDARTDSASVPFSAYSHASGSGAGHGRKEPQQVELGPQRFFPPEQPTGLEDLFGSVLGLKDADEDASANAKAAGGDRQLKRGGSSGAGAGAGRQDQMRKMAIASLLGAGIAFCAVAVVKVPSTSIWNVG